MTVRRSWLTLVAAALLLGGVSRPVTALAQEEDGLIDDDEVQATPPPAAAAGPAAEVVSTVDPTLPYPERLQGEWYIPALTCAFCSGLVGQTVRIDRQETVVKYYDRALLLPAEGKGQLILRSEKELLDLNLVWKDGALILTYYDQGGLPRVGESFAHMWVFTPTANDKLLYGRSYSLSAFDDDAFIEDDAEARWRANPKWFDTQRLLALLGDVRVYTLNEDRRLYLPSNDVRVAYDGAQALFRVDLTQEDLDQGEAADLEALKKRAERVAVFRTLVSAGDELFARGDYEKALAQYQAANSVRPGEGVVFADIGAAYQMQRKYLEADRSYRIAADLAPGDADILFNLGVVAEAQRQWVRARDLYRQVLERRPDDSEAQERLNVVEPLARAAEGR